MSAPTVLAVDDNDNDALLLKRACRNAKAQFNLISVEDGELAIRYLGSSDQSKFPEPAAMLLDLNMPRKTGFEVLQWLLEHPEAPRIPVVVFTSSNQESDIKRAYEIGATCYLVKPVQFAELVKIVQTIDAAMIGSEPLCSTLSTLPAYRSVPRDE